MKNISEDTLIDIENVSVSISNTGNVTILNSDSEIDCTDDDSICSTLSEDSASLGDDSQWYGLLNYYFHLIYLNDLTYSKYYRKSKDCYMYMRDQTIPYTVSFFIHSGQNFNEKINLLVFANSSYG